jgi:hypothetical protein
VANRDVSGADFRWIDESEIKGRSVPREAVYVERREYGPFIGTFVRLLDGDREIAAGNDAVWQALEPLITKAHADRRRIRTIERDEIGAVNARIEAERLAQRRLERDSGGAEQARARAEWAASERTVGNLQGEYASAEQRLAAAVADASRTKVVLAAVDGTEKELLTLDLFRAYRANELSFGVASGSTQAGCGSSSSRSRASRTPRRHFSGHLRHGDDGRADEHAGRALRRACGFVSSRICAPGRARPSRPDRGEQPRGCAVDRVRRLRS